MTTLEHPVPDDARLRAAIGSAINGFCQCMPGLTIPESARPDEEAAITEAVDAFLTVYNDLYDPNFTPGFEKGGEESA